MSKLQNWLDEKLFWLKTGYHLEVANNGKAVDPVVIRYKDFYFEIMLDGESGDPTGDFGWSRDPGIFRTPIREHYLATRKGEL